MLLSAGGCFCGAPYAADEATSTSNGPSAPDGRGWGRRRVGRCARRCPLGTAGPPLVGTCSTYWEIAGPGGTGGGGAAAPAPEAPARASSASPAEIFAAFAIE